MSATTDNNKPEDMMGYESQPTEETKPEATSTKETPQDTLNRMMKEVKTDEQGKIIYPDDIDPMLKLAMANAKSYRDTQSAYTKNQQSTKELEAERDALREKLAVHSQKPLELTTEQQTELDKLYVDNPNAWRAKMNMLEKQSSDAIQEELDTVTKEVTEKAGAEFELARRYSYLDEFNSTRGDNQITTDILDNDIPARINNKLANSEVTFEEYLTEVSDYLGAGKVVSKEAPAQTTDLNKANGGAVASGTTKEEGQVDYSSMTF